MLSDGFKLLFADILTPMLEGEDIDEKRAPIVSFWKGGELISFLPGSVGVGAGKGDLKKGQAQIAAPKAAALVQSA